MTSLFVGLYNFFHRKPGVFRIGLLVSVVALAWGASRVEFEEDITRIFPDDPRVNDLRDVFQRSRFVERLVLMIAQADTTSDARPDSLVHVAQALEERIAADFKPFVRNVSGRVDNDQLLTLSEVIHDHLPVFLDEKDFADLDSMNSAEHIPAILEANYRLLLSPSGIAAKRVIARDPLGYSFLVLRKLQRLQFDPNFELYDDYITTRDQRTLVMFAEPVNAPQDTKNNTEFLAQLDALIAELKAEHPGVNITYFGGTSVAVGNAKQLRKDSIITITAMVLLLTVLLVGFFRRKRVPFIVLLPAAFGGLFAVCCVGLLKGTISVLALAAGSVILGIAVNYAIHYLVHLSHVRDTRQTIKDLVGPLTLGGATTVLAFLFLQFANASVLRDIGLFAAFSLIGAALFTLVALPQIVSPSSMPHTIGPGRGFVITGNEGVIRARNERLQRVARWTIVILTPVFFWLASDVKFNTDMSSLNFMDAKTRAAQRQLETVNKASLGLVYVVSRGSDLEHALRKAEQAMPVLERLESSGDVLRFTSPAILMVSDSLQQLRLARWHQYWSGERRSEVTTLVNSHAGKLGFSPRVTANFDSLTTRRFAPADASVLQPVRRAFFENFIIDGYNGEVVVSLANTFPDNKVNVIRAFDASSSGAVDRQMLTNLFVEYVHADFEFIVQITAVLVFLALLLSYGRIELAFITFAPMFITWIWILGIMALLKIEFNIVNVMISTFIFGLGDDYSILVMDGLRENYRAGKKNMGSITTSILISALATIAGLGVLLFAKHPALRSIASISIVGIVCVLIMSQIVEPYLFRMLITRRTEQGRTPMTWVGMLRTFFTYSYFVIGSMLVTLFGLLLKLVPVARRGCRYLLHVAIRISNWSLIYLVPSLRKRIYGVTPDTFASSSVIVTNHSSFLDILLTTMLHPKLILLTNKWVYNSPVFGGVVRLADYYPVTEGAEDSASQFIQRVSEGYSIVVFPEGKRSTDGRIQRFHKGAFFLAEQLQLPIRPLLIHGAAEGIPKGTFYLNEAHLSLKFLPAIAPDDDSFGVGYAARTKQISKYFKSEFEKFSAEERTPLFYRYKLLSNYLYKGPVLEWYSRIKTKLENNYALFDQLLPRHGRILDLGCGYGYLCYMLQYLSADREITGVDYDEEKIETAQHGYTRTDRLRFVYGDVTTWPLKHAYSGIVISDVLHYLPRQAQDDLILRCADALADDGVLVIRDGNADLENRHRGTRLTEFFSVKLLGFNKSVNELHFVSGTHIHGIASAMSVDIIDQGKFTSNVIFVLRKKPAKTNNS